VGLSRGIEPRIKRPPRLHFTQEKPSVV